MARDERGYTIAELVLVLMIFSVIMTLISLTFSRIVTSSSTLMRATETDIGGLIGLELMRSDMELAGFGLPWDVSGASYTETLKGEMVTGFPGTRASLYNDRPADGPPRAYQAGDGVGFNGSDYLVIKGSAVGMSHASRKWGYLNYSSNGIIVKQSKNGSGFDPAKEERAIVLKSGTASGMATRELVKVGSSSFTLVFNNTLDSGFMPKSKLDSYLIYGVAPQRKDEEGHHILLSFPYNRADYHVGDNRGGAQGCAPKTGTLYKSTIDHSGGSTDYPILDCVADLQVLFMMPTSGDGSLVPHGDISGYNAEELRELLKEVRLYVMAQQGKRDLSYSFPMPDPETALAVGGRRWTRSEFLANGWQQYRWRVYTIVVQPKNL